MQLQLAHQPSGLVGFTRVCRITIQHHPDRLLRVPLTKVLQEATYLNRALVGIACPPATTGIHCVDHKPIEHPSSPLLTLQDQPLGGSIAPSSLRFHGNRPLSEEQQHAAGWKMAPNQADARQDRPPPGIRADQLAFDTPKPQPPFLSTRRRCSRLIAVTTRWSSR